MSDDKKSFVVYTGIKETLDELTDEQVAALFRGMVDYQLTGVDPEFSGTLKFAFIPIRQQMDRDNTKWERKKAVRAEAGRQGGIKSGEVRRAKAQAEANEANASQSQQNEANEANEAVNVNVDVNVNGDVDVDVDVSDSGSDVAALSSSLISYLNQKSGGKYKPDERTTERIGELLDAGYTEKDMRTVIDKKVDEWKDDAKMRGYLRPRTLFGDKFEEYLGAPVPVRIEEEQKQEEKIEKLKTDRVSNAERLDSVLDKLKEVRGRPGGIKENWTEFQELQDQRVVLEQNIEIIDRRLEAMM